MAPIEPFGETADPASYVPRPACERVLSALEHQIVTMAGCAALTAPPGMGKSLLLRVLSERISGRLRSLYLPYASVTLDDLCAWIMGLLDQPIPDDPRAGLRATVAALVEGGSGLVLLIDDANSMPVATARELGALLGDCDGGLRVVLAASDDARTSRVMAALAGDLADCRLSVLMSRAETEEYIDTRLRRAGAAEGLRSRFGNAVVSRIHRMSGGHPRHVHELANRIVNDGWPESRRGQPEWEDDWETGEGGEFPLLSGSGAADF